MPGRNPFPRESDRVDMKIHSKYPYKIANFLNNYIYIYRSNTLYTRLSQRVDLLGANSTVVRIIPGRMACSTRSSPMVKNWMSNHRRIPSSATFIGFIWGEVWWEGNFFFQGWNPSTPPFSVYPVGTVGVTSCTARDVSIARPVGASGPAGSNEASCDQLYSIGCIPIYSMCA